MNLTSSIIIEREKNMGNCYPRRDKQIGETRVAPLRLEHLEMRPASLKEKTQRLIDAGFNVISIPLMCEGYPVFPSSASIDFKLPSIHSGLKKRNVLDEVCEVCLDAGVPVMGYVEFLTVGDSDKGRRYPVLKKYRGWSMRNASNKMLPLGNEGRRYLLCPSSRDVVDYYSALCAEVTAAYPLSGLIVDVPPLKVPDQRQASDFCYCANCLNRYLYDLTDGEDVLDYQGRSDFRVRKTFHLREIFKNSILCLRNRVMQCRPDAMFFLQGALRREDGEFVCLSLDTVWHSLLAEGSVDGVFVTNYSIDDKGFASQLRSDIDLFPPKANLMVTILPDDKDTIITDIEKVRTRPYNGFAVMKIAAQDDEAMDQIEREALSWRGFFIEGNPLDAAISCLLRLHYLNGNCPPLQSLFRDLLRFLSKRCDKLAIEDVEGIIDNIEGICRQIKAGKMPLVDKPEKSLRLLVILQKSLFILCKGLYG